MPNDEGTEEGEGLTTPLYLWEKALLLAENVGWSKHAFGRVPGGRTVSYWATVLDGKKNVWTFSLVGREGDSRICVATVTFNAVLLELSYEQAERLYNVSARAFEQQSEDQRVKEMYEGEKKDG